MPVRWRGLGALGFNVEVGGQKDQSVIGELELSVLTSVERKGLKTELITNG